MINFWNWFCADENQWERFGYGKRTIALVLVFLVIPISTYYLVDWNPLIGIDEEGEPVRLGMYVMIGLFWIAGYFDYKRFCARKRLNDLLDDLFDEQKSQKIFEIIKRKQEFLKKKDVESELDYKEDEARLDWFRYL
jgi:hypothetical protein